MILYEKANIGKILIPRYRRLDTNTMTGIT